MSRISDGDDENFPGEWALYAANARRALTSKRGKVALTELRDALLALESQRLIEGSLCHDGQVCALGALAVHHYRQQGFDPIEAAALVEQAAYTEYCDEDESALLDYAEGTLGLSRIFGQQVAWENDEMYIDRFSKSISEAGVEHIRYERMLRWCERKLAAQYGGK